MADSAAGRIRRRGHCRSPLQSWPGECKEALLRSGASVGDDLWVSGRLGDAAGALKFRQAEPESGFDELPRGPVASLVARYDRPEPRLSLGIWLLARPPPR